MSELKIYSTHLKNGLKIKLRSAAADDAQSVINIGKHLMLDGEGQVIDGDEYNFTVEHESKWIKDHFENTGDILIIVELLQAETKKKEIIGILNFEAQKRRKISHTGEFGMGIHKNYRGLGIGKILLEQFILWAKSNKQIEKINLRVLENNQKAIKMYKNYGFKEDGRKTKEIKLDDGDYLDDISMELVL